MTPMPAPSRVAEAFHTLRTEVTVLRRNCTRYQRELAAERELRTRIERRLTGALFEIYGDWERVNREMPRA